MHGKRVFIIQESEAVQLSSLSSQFPSPESSFEVRRADNGWPGPAPALWTNERLARWSAANQRRDLAEVRALLRPHSGWSRAAHAPWSAPLRPPGWCLPGLHSCASLALSLDRKLEDKHCWADLKANCPLHHCSLCSLSCFVWTSNYFNMHRTKKSVWASEHRFPTPRLNRDQQFWGEQCVLLSN